MSEASPISWLWPDRTIGKRESRQLREEHNVVVNLAFDQRNALTAIDAKLTALLCERVLDSTMPEFHRVKEARDLARAALKP